MKFPIRMKELEHRYAWLYRPLRIFGLYALWVVFVRLLTLTFITYFTISPTSHFQDISDAFSSNEVSLMGLAAFLFVGLMYWLTPLTSISLSDIITRKKIEKGFLPGFAQGSVLAGGMISAFVLSGRYRYLGYFIQLEEAPLEILNVLLRMTALVALAYCEQFIFHYKMSRFFADQLPRMMTAILIGGLYCTIKILQFDLGWMHLLTLFLISISLFFRDRNYDEFSKSAGFWAAVLILFHPLLSLPVFGNGFSGVLLVKYYPSLLETDEGALFGRLLTGGLGGPLSSFAFQLLLILDICRSMLRQRNE